MISQEYYSFSSVNNTEVGISLVDNPEEFQKRKGKAYQFFNLLQLKICNVGYGNILIPSGCQSALEIANKVLKGWEQKRGCLLLKDRLWHWLGCNTEWGYLVKCVENIEKNEKLANRRPLQ
jgi:hypothetical protein